MPIAPRTTRALVALCLVAAGWLSAPPAPASALEPPRPLPGYHPAFVTETDQRPWKDCLWAAGAMLLDKWTNGKIIRTHQQLRRLSGDKGGSMPADLHVAFAKLGIDLPFSPNGGERITMSGLLRRLEAGAGAVVLGNDSKLPRWYGRWDYRFWKGKGKTDNHAVYVERYDRRHSRVWLMDPLARGDWKGEWISVSALYRFAWKSGGALYVAVTPTARPAPFAGIKLGEPELAASSTTLTAAWDLQTPKRWSFQGADVHVRFDRADDPLLAAATSPAVEDDTSTDAAPAHPEARVAGNSLRAVAALPADPGTWVATVGLTDRRFGSTVATAGPATVFVPGPRRGTIRLFLHDDAVHAAQPLRISVSVSNTGDVTWADPRSVDGAPEDVVVRRATRVVARWIPLDVPGAADGGAPEVPAPVVLGEVPLDPQHFANLKADLEVPQAAGRWGLAIDIVDDVDGSFAAAGSQPAIAVLDVAPTPNLDAIFSRPQPTPAP
jgi:hypothetical protein